MIKGCNAERGSPVVIGGVGGSGTRVVARILALHRFMGVRLTPAHDALDLAEFDWDWGYRYLRARLYGLPLDRNAMEADFRERLARHLEPLDRPAPWGWKHPHSIVTLPFLHAQIPELGFVHVLRDGRDQAFSSNENQVSRYGDLLAPSSTDGSAPAEAMRWWAWANGAAAVYGEEVLGPAYLRVRLEDLCAEPFGAARELLVWSGAGEAAEELAMQAAGLVSTPESIGRWRTASPESLAAVVEAGGDALARFGYDSVAGEAQVPRRPLRAVR